MKNHWPSWTALAFGHLVAMALVAAAVLFGLAFDRAMLQVLACVLLVAAIAACLSRRIPKAVRTPAGHAGLALWSFLVATAHGAGLMLVPALMPLCVGDGSDNAAADGSLLVALSAVAVHAAAMVAVTGGLAVAVRHGLAAGLRQLGRR